MKNTKITEIIESFRKQIKFDKMQTDSSIIYINILSRYINEKYNKNEDIEEIKKSLEEEFLSINESYCQKGNVSSDYLKLIALTRIVNDDDLVKEYCECLKDCFEEPQDKFFYVLNEDRNCEKIIKYFYFLLKQCIKEHKGAEQFRKINEGDYTSIVQDLANIELKELRINFKNRLIDSLLFSGEILEKYGLLERYTVLQKQNLAQVGCEKLSLPYSTGKYKRSDIGIKELFSKEFLDTLEIETLVILDMFYKNRLAKEYSSIVEAFLVIDDLNLWQEVMKKTKINMDYETINAVKNKMKCIQKILVNLIKTTNQNNSIKTENGYGKISVQENINKIVQEHADNYRTIFSNVLSGKDNDLKNDLEKCISIVNIIENLYKVRGTMLSSIVYNLIKHNSSKNFGIIIDEVKDGILINGIEKNMVLIGIDYERLNMPIRLHMPKSDLIDILKSIKGNTIIQVYEGNQDFVFDGSVIPTNVLFPTFKEYGEIIKKYYNNSSGEKFEKFIAHLRFLKEKGDGKYPKHLMEMIKTPKGTTYKRKPTRYIDLKDGTEYYISKKENKYIKNEDDGKGVK